MADQEDTPDLAELDFRAGCESGDCNNPAWFYIQCRGCNEVGFVCAGHLAQIRSRARRRLTACIHCDNNGAFDEGWVVEVL